MKDSLLKERILLLRSSLIARIEMLIKHEAEYKEEKNNRDAHLSYIKYRQFDLVVKQIDIILNSFPDELENQEKFDREHLIDHYNTITKAQKLTGQPYIPTYEAWIEQKLLNMMNKSVPA